ncbi:sensor domain-containing diguanylate cyclase [Pseudothermotoga thermarum]|uniref:Diguanylate cyclase with GAF sensor n=1 Tax=Pseudothermotoga thermarum DSM 5069 TaxID=688269 RepID=F7YUK4_9THEM|nr:diguanylate cyclase [Pseudothermotoga thermarum]AEH51476.1 diguanylate cyclase with GAF sensor [Pseudothermotoga thermarum DSM 5069]
MNLKIFWQAFMVFLVALFAALSLLTWLKYTEINHKFELSKNFFEKAAEFFVNSISVGYFQWTEMYEALIEQNEEEIHRQFTYLKADFPFIEEIFLQPADVQEHYVFEIFSQDNFLMVHFVVFDSNLERYVSDKIAVAKIDPNGICELFNIENISFDPAGKEFVFGLKAKYAGKLFELSTLVISLLVGLLAGIFKFSLDLRQIYVLHRELNKRYERKLQALQSILTFMEDFLRKEKLLEENEYQLILEEAVKIVPGAEAGSIVLEENGFYVFKAAVGFPLEELRKVKLAPQQLNRQEISDEATIIKNPAAIDKKLLTSDQYEVFLAAGVIEKIKSTLSLPLIVQGKIVGFFNLDNFHDENVFNEESIEIGKLFAGRICLLLERKLFEERIKQEQDTVKKLLDHSLKREFALQCIVDLIQKVLQGGSLNEEQIYNQILETAVKAIPGAQAGSFFLKEENFFVFKATAGYDLEKLKEIKIEIKKEKDYYSKQVQIIKHLPSKNGKTVPLEQLELLRKYGRLDEIKSTLRIPVIVRDEIIGVIHLDNFEGEDAFDNGAIKLGQLFSSIVAVLLNRLELEKLLIKEKELTNNLFKQALRRSAALRKLIDFVQEILQSELPLLEEILLQVLKSAIEVVPGAQAGSLLLIEDHYLVFKTAVGYDLEQLKKVRFDLRKIPGPFDKRAYVARDLAARDSKILSPEELEILRKFGRLDQIKCVLRLPILVGDEPKGLMHLDNFENEDAFDEESLQIGQLFSNIVGVLLYRLQFEKQLREEREKFEHLSYHDSLTQLPNRRYLFEFGSKMLALADRESEKVSLLYMDLKKFKNVNDTFGHAEGDEVLKIVAQRLKELLRKSDLIARVGGDEFVTMAYGTDINGAVELAKRIEQAIEKPIETRLTVHVISANIGIAVFPEDGETLEGLLTKADRAMYYAKINNLAHATTDDLEELL